jgi:phosphoribosylformylglycinamidine cyclo-ligase
LKSITYKDSGVDIEKGNQAVRQIKAAIHETYTEHVISELGGFGGLYRFPQSEFSDPVLVSSTDGVGTKLKVAFLMDKHDTVGEDLVNHCVNDIAVTGAKPLFFLDYFASGKLESHVFNQVISGFVRGCKNNRCALIGGETAEMPDMYQKGEYDLSGTIVGVVDRPHVIDGASIQQGDMLVGIQSNGLHTNGYSLARKVLLSSFKVDDYSDDLNSTIGEELLRVHLSYLPLIMQGRETIDLHGIAHITGGGIEGNTKRLLTGSLGLKIDWQSWDTLPVFEVIKKIGHVPEKDMRQTFNLGIGLIFIIAKGDVDKLIQLASANAYKSYVIGSVVSAK